MRNLKRWEDGEFTSKRPLVFFGWPASDERPSTFAFVPGELKTPLDQETARLYYRAGWTALVFWNADVYFADQISTFDAMMELLRSRFENAFYLRALIVRDYVD